MATDPRVHGGVYLDFDLEVMSMPPAASRIGESTRLADRLAIQTVLAAFPPETVDRVLETTGRIEQRRRLLSARTTVYYVLTMGLFPGASYEEVARRLFDARSWGEGSSRPVSPPSKGAIYKARARVGWEPVRALFEDACAEVLSLGTAPLWLAGRRVIAWVAASFALAASPANQRVFSGRPDLQRGPELCVETLVLAGSGALLSASVGSCAEGAIGSVVEGAFAPLQRDMLCVGRLSSNEGLTAWPSAARSGAQLLWGVPGPLALRVRTPLSDGSYLATTSQLIADDREPLVRVIDLAGSGEGREADAPSRLLTTLLDPHEVTAGALERVFALCAAEPSPLERLQSVPGERAVLRSKAPDGVVQEAYGHLCLHHVAARVSPSRSGQSIGSGRLSFPLTVQNP